MSALIFFLYDCDEFSYFRSLCLHGSSDDIRRFATLVSFELVIFAGVQFLLNDAKGVTPDYYVGSLGVGHVGGGMIFWLPPIFVNVLSHLGLYRIAE